MQRETEGFSVELRDLKYDALGQDSRAIVAEINLNPAGEVTLAVLDWRGQPHKQ